MCFFLSFASEVVEIDVRTQLRIKNTIYRKRCFDVHRFYVYAKRWEHDLWSHCTCNRHYIKIYTIRLVLFRCLLYLVIEMVWWKLVTTTQQVSFFWKKAYPTSSFTIKGISDFSHCGELCRKGHLPDVLPHLAAAFPLVLLPDSDDSNRQSTKTGELSVTLLLFLIILSDSSDSNQQNS